MKLVFVRIAFVLVLTNIFSAAIADSYDLLVYSSRKTQLIKPILDEFTADTGIKVKYRTSKAEALIERISLEGYNSPADLLITVDAGNLWYAANKKDIFAPFHSTVIENNIPHYLRDTNNLWTGLSIRARTIVYNKDKIKKTELSTYADLANNKWKNSLCLRTSKKIYTKSLVASIIHHKGIEKTRKIVKGWVNNLASPPHSLDLSILKSIVAGQCDVGIVNTYYFFKFIKKNPNVPLGIHWANQNTTGIHVNISGAGIVKYSKNKQLAVRLLEWLTTPRAQKLFTKLNYEYPANPNVKMLDFANKFGKFKHDTINLSILGKNQKQAVRIMRKEKYK